MGNFRILVVSENLLHGAIHFFQNEKSLKEITQPWVVGYDSLFD